MVNEKRKYKKKIINLKQNKRYHKVWVFWVSQSTKNAKSYSGGVIFC